MQEVLQKIFLGNRVLDYFIASLTFLSGVLIILILKKFLVKSLKVLTEKSKLALKDSLSKTLKRICYHSLITVFSTSVSDF